MKNHVEIQIPRPVSSVNVVPGRSGGSVSAPPPRQTAPAGRAGGGADRELAGLRSARQALEKAVVKFGEIHERFFKEAEEQLLNLSIEIARKVLKQEIQTERHKIEPVVREALSRVPDGIKVVVHLHPDDLARCESARKDTDQAGSDNISFIADRKVQPGGCLLETPQGTVESSIDAQLEEIAGAMKNPE